MSVFHSHTTIDCHDAYALSEWWRVALDYAMDPQDPNLPGHAACMIRDPASGHTLLFQEVPDEELPAKRIHLDVRPRERTRDEEIAWLLEHGAVALDDHRGRYGPGSGWLVMADPEGNPFCVLRSLPEVAAMEGASGH
ncbi:VOC family protein [Brachybacterium sp. YJGR34]|uniref:VOC family protein n=1 Tax=Brachybacterium sp. YJGR34 TaxID=2059911 RepID=UPI000E0AB993|nr:VOC family protein [Brachybacterium sp. YJGR34]